MTGAANKRRKLNKQSADDDQWHVIMLQDAVEPSKAASQGGAQSELAEQSTAHANGNSNSDIGLHAATQSRQQLPIHPLFNANSSRVYPEWSVPEPVALPRRANGFWGSSWSQPLVAEATQAAATHAQALPEPAQFHSPALGIPDTQITKSESLEGAPFQPAQTPDVPHAPTQSAADQLQTVETMPAQQSPLPGLVSEQPHHPTTGQVSTTQPSSSAATLHPTPATTNAQPPLHDMPLHIVATQNAATAVEQRSANELPQPVSNQQQQQPPRHLQAGQQHSEATLYWQSKQQPPQQQQQQQQLEQQGAPQQQTEDMQHHQQASQHLLELVTGSADQAPAETEGMNQEPAGGATDEAPMTAAPNVGAYSQRELFLQNMESAGEMSFEYVLNDGQRHNSIWLIGLKNIFSKQLPNMPREYIARLVLDRRHRSVAIIRRKRNVVGGITYRPFHKQRFGEIAFCAVTANEQVKGFGTRLMNYTKEYAKTQDQLTHFLTYADNNAVGYFSKQGFTKEITLDKEWWVGYIKDYDGGTLMECVIVQRLPHTRLPAMLQAQKKALDSRIRQYSKSHVAHPGLSAFQEGCRRVDISRIPGVKEASWDPGDSSGTGVKLLMNNSALDATPNNLQHFLLMVVREMQQHEDAWAFLHPVSLQDVPDYLQVIKDPMDLSLMEQRLKKKDYYLTLDIFAADMRRICNNARVYNASESPYYKSANRLEAFFDQYMHAHLLFGQ
ncbi:hypothetical protein ABBQ32_012315 [Trebouxia sp. C0010 RCD-2024]